MARNTGPSCRLCRREGIKLFLKGARCNGEKCGELKKCRGRELNPHEVALNSF